MEEFPDLGAFLEHVSLVMDVDNNDGGERVSIMTLHGAKGLEFETVFLPGWEEGLFPHQRSLDENGRAGLEEERRLAYVGVTRARRRVKILFASNRRIHGLWQTTVPSRFIDDLPADHVRSGGRREERRQLRRLCAIALRQYGCVRLDAMTRRAGNGRSSARARRAAPQDRRAENHRGRDCLAQSTPAGKFAPGVRIFHSKFGSGMVAAVDGAKLTIDFDKAGRKLVLDTFVELRD